MERPIFLQSINKQFECNRIVALLGPRQSGKTTLAKQFCKLIPSFSLSNYFDLENPNDLLRLENPKLAFEQLEGVIIIDEIQRKPDLFQVLRYIHDEYPHKHFLLLGSASREIINQSSENLAGRIGYIEITPFQAHELKMEQSLWLRGGFPRSYLATSDDISYNWRSNYVRTYLEQDIPSMLGNINTSSLRKFWMMLANYHGQIFNALEMANSLQISRATVVNYLDILAATFMIRVLQPWFENIKKRQVKSPKIYIRDSGIFHYLLGIQNKQTLLTSPKLGASWEGFALEQIINSLKADQYDCYFWATHSKAELDLMIVRNGQKIGFEFKYQDAPKISASMRIAMQELNLAKLIIIYPGEKSYYLDKNIQVVGFDEYVNKGMGD
jgi:predicted AAA+ superfamily ATPase